MPRFYRFKYLTAALSRANLLKRRSKDVSCPVVKVLRYGTETQAIPWLGGKATKQHRRQMLVCADMGQNTCDVDQLGTLEPSALQST